MKRLVSLVTVALLVFGVLSFAFAQETVALKVWGTQEDQELLGELIEQFKTQNPDTAWDITLGVVGDADAKARYLEDPAAAADVFTFPDDQLVDLVKADALYEVTNNRDAIVAANAAGSIQAASINGVLYGYPMTADNGYFLYYDKSVFTQEDVQTLDGMLAAANAAGKKVHMDVSNGWYIASFFLGAGCKLDIDADGKQVCDFNNANGLAAAKAILALCSDPAFITGDDSVLQGNIGDTISAGISGTWVATAIKEKLGENYGASKLPTFTLNGQQVQMGSFLGCKILGVNTQTQHPVEAMKLAEFLTSEQSQIRRFEVRGYGPSNIQAAQSTGVQSNIALAALAAQSQFATSQHVLGAYWVPAEALGQQMEAKTADDLQGLLDALVAQVTAQ